MTKKNILARSRKNKVERLLNNKQLAEAHTLCKQICKTAHTDTEAWTMLGLIERNMGHLKAAQNAINHAIKVNARFANAHKILGTVQQLLGQASDAIVSYQQAIALQPDDAEVHYLLGNIQRETGELKAADKAYTEAIKLHPDYLEALSNRAAILIIMGQNEEAEKCLNGAKRLQPDIPQVQCNLAMLYLTSGKEDVAEKMLRDILAKDPDFVDAIELLAEKLEKKYSHIKEARELIKHGLTIDPDRITLHLTIARINRQEGNFDAGITRLEALRTKLPLNLQHDILLLLGQLYDKSKMADKAFFCLSEGNRLKQKTTVEEAKASREYLEHVKKLAKRFHESNPETWRTFPEDDFDKDPVFLFGFPRSGTTLLEQILDSHPRLQALPEKPAIHEVVRALGDKPISSLEYNDIQKLRQVYFAEVDKHIKRDPDLILVDKMPLNTTQAHLIYRLFPNAKCILAIRHPCDAVFSCFMQNFVLNQAMSTFFTLEKTAEAYAGVMSLWQDYISVLPIKYHRIRYEDLVADQVGETKRLISFLELEWDDQVLHHDKHAQSRHINTPSYHQVTKPIYQDAKYRWRRYEKYMQSVLPVLQPYIDYFDYSENNNTQSD